MRKILILMGRYLPGHKDGGPLRTVVNVTEALGDEYEFYIACLDRDHGDDVPYANIKIGEWNQVGKAKVWYVKPGGFTNELLLELIAGKDLVYLSSFYEDYGYKTLILNKQGKLKNIPIVIAAMGVFSKGALEQKKAKKKIFIRMFKGLGLFKNITWSVTSELEKTDVKRTIGNDAACVIAEDMPRTEVPGRMDRINQNDVLSIAFLSRISPKKNLIAAIRCLKNVKNKVDFTIYGPAEDVEYWKKCQKELKELPPNITWNYRGDVPSELVQKTLGKHEVFLFPTLGENYGHVIFEALSVGCITVISNQTPWQDIEKKGAGFVLQLSADMKEFTNIVERIAKMTVEQRIKMSDAAVMLAKEKVAVSKLKTGYREIFG